MREFETLEKWTAYIRRLTETGDHFDATRQSGCHRHRRREGDQSSNPVAAPRTPIVFTQISDPLGMGLVASIARPGERLTGVTNLFTELVPKRPELTGIGPGAAVLVAAVRARRDRTAERTRECNERQWSERNQRSDARRPRRSPRGCPAHEPRTDGVSASSSMEPLRSAKRTVTCLRLPSRALLEVRIFSARCFGV
jgi:hypothetical protein